MVLKVAEQAEANQGQGDTDHHGDNQLGLECRASGGYIGGCHESLYRSLVPGGGTDVPHEHVQESHEDSHPGRQIPAKEWLGIPVFVPLGGKPAEAAVGRNKSNHDQRATEQEDGLHQVCYHNRLHATQRRVDHGNKASHHNNQRHPLFVHAHHHDQGLGSEVDQQCHPDQSQQDEHRGAQQPNPHTQLLLQQLVGTGHTLLHVNRQDAICYDPVDDRHADQRDQAGWTLAQFLARYREIRDGA